MKKYSIYDITNLIKKKIINESFTIIGEVYDLKLSHSHLYFYLKDSKSIIKVIIWSSNDLIDKKILKNGLVIEAYGNLNYYDKNSSISFIINRLTIINTTGLLQAQIDEWKLFYEQKGYFTNKLKLPNTIINNIIIITSRDGAALQDIMYVLNKNNYNGKYSIIDTIVQGDKCVSSVSTALENVINLNPQLVILTRGGGSLEDLIYFSDPIILEALYKLRLHNISTISAIGHEVDYMLCDYVSDIRCPTPSLAGEYIITYNKNILTNFINLIKTFINNEKKIINNLINIIQPTKKLNYLLNNINSFIITEKNNINSNKQKLDVFYKNKLNDLLNMFLKFIYKEKNNFTSIQLVDKNNNYIDLSTKKNFIGYIIQNNIKYKVKIQLI